MVYDCTITALASDLDGNLLLGGCIAPFKTSTVEAFSVTRLAADDGALTWQRIIRGGRAEYDSPTPFVDGIAVAGNGRIVAAGSTTTPATGADFTVVQWRPR